MSSAPLTHRVKSLWHSFVSGWSISKPESAVYGDGPQDFFHTPTRTESQRLEWERRMTRR
ncbi:hypothetical protein CJF30_00006654 [Rutstroemia sp. NJR-2017a BBW]|nr:hypothetical protein CJF30_00006654 [Rutstroemia sp. NJR-2017a BBW]